MAERAKPKRRSAASTTSKTPKSDSLGKALERLEAKADTLRNERDALAAKLKDALARIKALEEANSQAVNRIDWVIDSLQNLLEDEK